MAFKLQNFSKWSVSFNRIAANQYGYNGATNGVSDDANTIIAIGYFDSVATTHLLVDDIIFVRATNGTFFAEVADITDGVVTLGIIIIPTPNNVIKFIGRFTIPNLNLIQVFSAPGVGDSTDVVTVQIEDAKGDTNRVVSAVVLTNQFSFEFDPGPTQLQDFQVIIAGVAP